MDFTGKPLQSMQDAEEAFVVKGAQRALQAGGIADHVARAKALHAPEVQQPRRLLWPCGNHLRRAAIELHGGAQRIHALVAACGAARPTREAKGNLAGAAHHRARAAGDGSQRQIGPQVHAEHRLHIVLFKHAALADVPRTAGGLLGGLEDQQHVAVHARVLHPPRQLQQHGHVAVVATGVHLARVLRGVGQKAALVHGQSVAAAAKGDGACAAVVKEGAQRIRDRRKHPAAQAPQRAAQVGHGAIELPIQLRDPVQRAPVGDDLFHGKDAPHRDFPPSL